MKIKIVKEKISYLIRLVSDYFVQLLSFNYKEPENLAQLQRQQDEVSRTIRRGMLVLVGTCIFVLISIATPDSILFFGTREIKIPFANISISFQIFMLLLPLILIGELIYLHIFIGYSNFLMRKNNLELLPYIFNLENRLSKSLSWFIFYLLVPLTLYTLMIKAQPYVKNSFIFSLTLFVIFVLSIINIVRYYNRIDKKWVCCQKIFSIVVFILFITSPFYYEYISSPQGFLHRVLNLSGIDLSKKDLSLASFVSVNFNRANLNETDLSNADLRMSKFQYANLNKANLRKANLMNSDFIGAQLQGADLSKANLESVNLTMANIINANIEKSIIVNGNLFNARLDNSSLRKSQLNDAQLETAHLIRTNLEKAELKYANFDKALMKEAKLRKANLNGATLRYADLRGANLRSAKIQFADLESANLQGANLAYANLCFSNLRNANLQGADLSFTKLYGAYFEGTNLKGTNFFKAKLQGSYLDGVDLRGAYLDQSEHHGVVLIFSNSKINGISGEIDTVAKIDWEEFVSKIEIKESDRKFISNKIFPEILERSDKFNSKEYIKAFDKQKNKIKFLEIRQQIACSDHYIAIGILNQFSECDFNNAISVDQLKNYISNNCKDILTNSSEQTFGDTR